MTDTLDNKYDSEEDDYLKMTFDEPSNRKVETLTEKKKRLAREAEARARPKSKAQLAEEERQKRDNALQTSTMDTSSKAYKMMAKLGYKAGSSLGKPPTASQNDDQDESVQDKRLTEPIGIEMKEDRSGIGADSEKKRKFREEVERQVEGDKKRKVDADEFRIRQQKEREEKKMEGQLWGAMKVAEKLDEEDAATTASKDNKPTSPSTRPLGSINVLWRGLIKQRLIKERDRRMRYDLNQSLSRLPIYEDSEEEADDKIALERKGKLEEVDLELDQDDTELDEFESMEISQKLERLVQHLRGKWHYCFWCKYRYPDANMDGCPGLTEEDHD